MRMAWKEAMVCCKLYISESRNEKALSAIARVAEKHRHSAPLVNTFPDREYNRVGYTLVGALKTQPLQPQGNAPPSPSPSPSPSSFDSTFPLHRAVVDMVGAALSHIDMEQHVGSHPRLGVVDHMCFHPLGSATLTPVASLALAAAQEISLQFQVPTYVYGAAHPNGKRLDAIRRDLGYFSPNAQGQWKGTTVRQESPTIPDFGPGVRNPKTGVVVIGACPWIANYNVPILSNDLQLGAKIARKVSARGGGLPAVQAMALLHGSNKLEIACNLLDTSITSGERVQEEVAKLAHKENIDVEPGYFTDFSEEQITELAYEKLFANQR